MRRLTFRDLSRRDLMRRSKTPDMRECHIPDAAQQNRRVGVVQNKVVITRQQDIGLSSRNRVVLGTHQLWAVIATCRVSSIMTEATWHTVQRVRYGSIGVLRQRTHQQLHRIGIRREGCSIMIALVEGQTIQTRESRAKVPQHRQPPRLEGELTSHRRTSQ